MAAAHSRRTARSRRSVSAMMIDQSQTRLSADHIPDAAEDERVAVAHNRVLDVQSTAASESSSASAPVARADQLAPS